MTNITIKLTDLFKDEQKEAFSSQYPVRVLYREDENMTVDQCRAIMEGKTKFSFLCMPGSAETSGDFAEGFIAGMLASEPGMSAYVTAQPIGLKSDTLSVYSTVKEAIKGLSQTKKPTQRRTRTPRTTITSKAMNPPVEKGNKIEEKAEEKVLPETHEEEAQAEENKPAAEPEQIVLPVKDEEKMKPKTEEKPASPFDRVLAKEAPEAVGFRQAVLGALQTSEDTDGFIFTFGIMAGNSDEAQAAGKAAAEHFETLKAAADKEPEADLDGDAFPFV